MIFDNAAASETVLNNVTVTTPTVNRHFTIATGVYTFTGNGTLDLDYGTVIISDALSYANETGEFQLIDTGLLSNLSLGNNWLTGFIKSDNIWTNTDNSAIFFDSTSGILNVTQIPEPTTWALLLTSAGLLALLHRRR
ncbi:MAG: PEP-CTERM sorting domain-containing protein [Verrucomicrobiales bacterium]|nr:PEP-CTERM sorting domain-containing protein [Verrucomicrobiales bacterium]